MTDEINKMLDEIEARNDDEMFNHDVPRMAQALRRSEQIISSEIQDWGEAKVFLNEIYDILAGKEQHD